MPTPRRPWTDRLLVLVDEGVTDRDELIRRATACVPVGHAFRARESVRRHAIAQYQRRYPDAPRIARREPSTSEIHRVGARVVLNKALAGLVDSGTLVRDGAHYRRPSTHAPDATHGADEVAS